MVAPCRLQGRSRVGSSRLRHVALSPLFVGSLVWLLVQIGGHAAVIVDPLPYSNGYLVTGNYVAGGIDLNEDANPPDQDGLSTGQIHINGVPGDADIVAAYLFWEAITSTADPSQAAGVKFRGQDLSLADTAAVKRSSQNLVGTTATCWSSGTPLTMHHFKADVLRFLPMRLDKNNQPTGKRLVNDADLAAHGEQPHTVTLPTRNGNLIPEGAGATLAIVYRDPSEPLRKILFYDGLYIQTSLNDTMSQTLRGFYDSADTRSARITHVLAGGQPNNNEQVRFVSGTNDTLLSSGDPVMGVSASERSWATLTYDVPESAWTAATPSLTGYGETVTTKVLHSPPTGGGDCLAWGAIIFSTAVADVDHDGLPDGIENSTSGLNDPPTPSSPGGQPLPNLHAMGASSTHKDIFVEFNAMRTLETKVHGSASAPYSSTDVSVPVPPHTHMPTPEVLKMIGDAYAAHGIMAHFDVGDITSYHNHGMPYDPDGMAPYTIPHADWVDDYSSAEANPYLISIDPRGGEVLDERACEASVPTCQFPDFPGTVGWKFGLELIRDWPVGVNGEELFTLAELQAWNATTDHRIRFDRNRTNLFHYVVFAHTRGLAKSAFPCLDISTEPDTPTGYGMDGTCSMAPLQDNPDFYVPSSASGVADLPGSSAMVTLGRWDEFVGKPFVQASTAFHELGHNLNLGHGGILSVPGNKALNTATYSEPNCKPNYLSSMSYLFQVHGLFDLSDNIHLDLSGAPHDSISETAPLNDLPLSPVTGYRPAWYAPAGSVLATTLGVSPAKSFCNGMRFDPTSPPAPTARVYTDFSQPITDPIDWNGDGVITAADTGQDVNFDNQLSATFNGFDDWSGLRLDQIGAGRNVTTFVPDAGGLFLGEGSGLFLGDGGGIFLGDGSGIFLGDGGGIFLGDGGGIFLGEGSGLLLGDGGGIFLGDGSGIYLGEGGGIFLGDGSGIFLGDGSGIFLGDAGGASRQELDVESAKGMGRSAPYAFTACVLGTPGCPPSPAQPPAPFDPLYHRVLTSWRPPPVGSAITYQLFRKRGYAASSYSYVPVPPPSISSTSSNDPTQLPDGVQFTFRVRARFGDETPPSLSGFSNPTANATITAVNNAPVANPDSYTTTRNRALDVPAPGVLASDTDVDSPASVLRAVLEPNSGPSNGTLTLNADGSFTYRPRNGFTGTDSFKYRANNGTWTLDLPEVPISADSDMVTVTITVTR